MKDDRRFRGQIKLILNKLCNVVNVGPLPSKKIVLFASMKSL